MSAPQWKPGDVAMRSYLGKSRLSVRVPDCSSSNDHQRGEHWHHADGGWDARDGRSTYRPLVVIDPEDREQVERLLGDYYGFAYGFASISTHSAAKMQAALRSLVTPPKPQVFSHLKHRADQSGLITSLCGKVWRAGEDVEVVGQCPECRALVEEWIA